MPALIGTGELTIVDIRDGLTIGLSNTNHSVPTDENGENGDYTNCSSTIAILVGSTDDTANWIIQAIPSVGVVGVLNSKTYTVTNMTVDVGTVDFVASRIGFTDLVVRFTISKNKAGKSASQISVVANQKNYITDEGLWGILINDSLQTGQSRGHKLVTLNPATDSIVSNTNYDTYAADANVNSLAAAINAVADGMIVILTTWDATACNQTLRDALRTCGSDSIETWTAERRSHAFIGQKGIAVGGAYEKTGTGNTAAGTSKVFAYYGTSGIVKNGSTAVNAISAVLTNDAHSFTALKDGTVSSYAGSGTEIRVYDGTQLLIYDAVGTSVGTWKITTSAQNITVGTITDSGDFAAVGNHSAITADTATITYTITGKTKLGNSFTLVKSQTFSKSKAGDNAISVILSNEAHSITASNTGVIAAGAYAGSGTEIRVYDGADLLIYDAVGTASGTWKITTSAQNITVGTITDSGDFATIGNQSNMTADTATITYTITGKNKLGISFAAAKTQSFSKSKAGDQGDTGTRGTLSLARAITGNSWSDTEALTAITDAGGVSPLPGDVVTLYNVLAGFSQTRIRGASTWNAITGFYGGDVILDNSLSANKIKANSITSDQISAGSISTSKLLVVPESLCPDANFKDISFWSNPWDASGWAVVDSPNSVNTTLGVDRSVYLNTGITTRRHIWSNFINFTGAGRTLRLSAKAANNSGASVTVAARLIRLDNTYSDINVTFPSNGGALASLSNTLVVPNNTVKIQFIVYNAGSGAGGTGQAYVSAIRLEVVASAELIVDGAITADKIAAGAITADKISANAITATKIATDAITADKISANAITASKLNIGDTTNAFPDPTLAEASLTTWEILEGTTSDFSISNSGAGISFSEKTITILGGKASQISIQSPATPVEPNSEYFISAWCGAVDNGGFTTNSTGQLYARWFGSTGTFISETLVGQTSVTLSSRTTPSISGVVVAPNSAVTVKLKFTRLAGASNDAARFTAPTIRRAVNASLIVNGAITADAISAGAITTNKLSADAITADKISAGAITTDKLSTGAIIADKISANAITTDKLSILSKEYVNPVSTSKNLIGWVLNDDGSGTVPSNVSYDSIENGILLTSNANHSIRSKSWEINHSKIYRVSFKIKSSDTGGTYYVGIAASTAAMTFGVSATSSQGTSSVIPYSTSRISSSATTNPYFYSGNKSTSYVEFVCFIIGANRDINECPLHIAPGGTPFLKVDSAATHVALRFLNWSNSTVSRSMWIKDIAVTELGSGIITAENISAGAITADKISAGAITADKISAGAITADNIDSRGLTIRDSEGNIILSAGSSLQNQINPYESGATVGANASNLTGFDDIGNLFPDIFYKNPAWGTFTGDWLVGTSSVINSAAALRYITESKTSTTNFIADKTTPAVLFTPCTPGETIYISAKWATAANATGTWALIPRFYDKNKVVLSTSSEPNWLYMDVPSATESSKSWKITVPTGAAYMGYRVRRGSDGANIAAIGWCEIGQIQFSRSESGATRNVFRGDWATSTNYSIGDIVLESGYGWSCIQNHTSSSSIKPPTYPATSNTYWTAYTIKGDTGADAVVAILSNEAHVFPASSAGAVSTYSGSGTDIYVYEGANALAYDGVGTSTGTWKIATASSNITVGTITDSGSYVTVGNHSGVASGTDTSSITYTITGKTSRGASFSLTKTQTFSKSKAGVTGPQGPAVVLVSNRPTSFTSTDGTLDGSQANIVFTANVSGIDSPTYAWSFSGLQTNPTASTTNTQTITAAQFGTSRSAIVTVTVNGTIVDKMTIVRLEQSTAAAGATVGADSSNLQVGNSTNLLPNTEFGGRQHEPVTIGNNLSGCVLANEYARAGADVSVWAPPGRNALVIYQGNRTNAGQGADAYLNGSYGQKSTGIPVVAGKRYELSAKLAAHRCQVGMGISWFDTNSVRISDSILPVGYVLEGGESLSLWSHVGIFGTAPAGAVFASIWARKMDTDVGQTSSYFWICEPFFGEANPAQTSWSVYSPGSPRGALANVNQITPGNASTYIANAAIGSAQIGQLKAANIEAGAISTEKLQIGSASAVNIFSSSSNALMPWGNIEAKSVQSGNVSNNAIFTTSGGNISVAGFVRLRLYNATLPSTVANVAIATEIYFDDVYQGMGGWSTCPRLTVGSTAFSGPIIVAPFNAIFTDVPAGTHDIKIVLYVEMINSSGARQAIQPNPSVLSSIHCSMNIIEHKV